VAFNKHRKTIEAQIKLIKDLEEEVQQSYEDMYELVMYIRKLEYELERYTGLESDGL
jgi:hypothetical protein